jgi:hypothetical protein
MYKIVNNMKIFGSYHIFCLKTTWVKMCGESEFGIYKIPRIQEKLYIEAKIRENHLLIELRDVVLNGRRSQATKRYGPKFRKNLESEI